MSCQSEIDRKQVEKRLDSVTDPELDRSIVELDYIDRIEISEGAVEVAVTLPTAWCSPAFAWMMMTDARDALESDLTITDVTIRLCDHMHATEINDGVNHGLAFEQAFEDADDSIEEVRRTLDGKARLARQYRAISALLEAGLREEQIVRLTREEIDLGDEGQAVVRVDNDIRICVDDEPIRRYLEKATQTGVLQSNSDLLFATLEGDPISPSEFEMVHKRGRLAETNMASQKHVCENLGEARIGGPTVI